jgi:hypothetical protein
MFGLRLPEGGNGMSEHGCLVFLYDILLQGGWEGWSGEET